MANLLDLRPFLRIDQTLSLHLPRPELAEAVFAAIDTNRPHLRQWLPWVDATKSLDDTKTFIREGMHHNSMGTRLTTFIRFGDALVGSVGGVHIDKYNKKCEIGYWLREDFQGKGIMTQACRALIGHLFAVKKLHRIEILAQSSNLRSRAVPTRLNFHLDGTLRQALFLHGEFHDLDLFSLLAQEWKPR